MKFNSLRTSLVGSAFALLAAVLLGSCGGGGAGANFQGGNLQLLPLRGATFFAGVPATMSITGGRMPYRVVSSEPGVLPVPLEVNSTTFQVIPNNPGVIDTGIGAGELPFRTVIINVTDSTGGLAVTEIRVAQNFLTGYGVFYTSNCTGGATTAPAACAGGETNIRLEANFNGNLTGNRTFRLEILRGPFFWVFPNGGVAGNTITVTTDHEGKANAIFRVTNNVQTQIGVYRIVDVETGASTEQVFIIDGTDLAADLVIIPDQFTFTGPFTTTCGTGTADFLVFDGIPPYTAVSSFSSVSVSPSATDAQPGRFTLTVGNPNVCLTDATIIITDSNNARGTVTVTTEAGSADPPPPALRVVPSTVNVTCGASASVAVVGGSGTYAVTSVDPDVTATIAGNTITITRNPDALNPSATNTTSQVVVTDGSTTATVNVVNPVSCF